mgnify:FL=1
MKLKNTFITHTSNNEQILVDTSGKFSGIVRNNKTAAFIVDCLKEETSIEEIINKMSEEYDAPLEDIKKGVDVVLDTLRKVGALDE